MISDFRTLGNGPARFESDLCIIGAGVAGITLARRFLGTSRSVLLVESGGKDYEDTTQDLYAGENIGAPYYELDEARLRFFGGTIHIWGGRNCPLDEVDFQSRPWVPGSGWPIARAELESHYRKAHDDLGLGPFHYDGNCWPELGASPLPLDRTRLKFGFWRFDMASGRYELDRCGDLRGSRNISVLLHANVTHLQASRDARRIEHVEIKSLHGHRAVIVARNFVLACGGIENPRLLLAANDVEARGVGNRHDHVGRCFMEHPHARAARVDAPDPFRLYQYFQPHAGASGVWIAPSVQASESLQQELEILNTSVTVKLLRVTGRESTFTKRFVHAAKRDLNPTRFGRDMWRHFRRLRQFLRLPGVRKLRWWYTRFDGRELYLFIRGEQAPNPASRLVLSESRDALGVPRASLDWRLTALDKRSAAVLVDTVAGEFARLGLGSVTPEPWLGDASLEWPAELAASSHPIGGYHHMGTTRMSDNPADGVVDRNCRVHGYSNLFVAGSSVFPTSGWANPTLTIVALAHRLGEYLAARMD